MTIENIVARRQYDLTAVDSLLAKQKHLGNSVRARRHERRRPQSRLHVPFIIKKLAARLVPWPGIEAGLEVPETSVMSFSLPGRPNRRHNYNTVTTGTSEPRNYASRAESLNRLARKSACAGA